MRSLKYLSLSIVVLVAATFTTPAQETQTKVVDEVIAQVNGDVITLSQVKRESQSAVDAFIKDGKTKEEAQRLIDEKLGELIASLINEALLLQKAKEMNLDNDIEAALNQRFLEVMKQYNLKTVEDLYKEMERNNVDPKDIKEEWRRQITKDNVIQREVQSKVYWGITGAQIKAYYDKHRDQFTTPETVSFSELFLTFAGRDESAVRTKAKKLLEDLRAGADFAKAVKDNGDPGPVTQSAGKAEKIKVKDLPDGLSKPLTGVPTGGYAEPFDADNLGMVILRVDERVAASKEAVFDEKAVRVAMLPELIPAEQKKFFSKLRDDAYIKVNDTYRPIVSPILFAEERKDKPTVSETAAEAAKTQGSAGKPKNTKTKKPDRKN